MEALIKVDGFSYRVNLANPYDLSIPVQFGPESVQAFGIGPPLRIPFRSGSFLGSVTQGGSCNCEVYTMTPHGHGTHTESIAHVLATPVPVHEVLPHGFLLCTVVTLACYFGRSTEDSYRPSLRTQDRIITKADLQQALAQAQAAFLQAVVVRTLPNDDSKKSKNYDRDNPPFFTNEAMGFLNQMGVRHLLVDMPSIDRLDDDGILSNHRIFWGLQEGQVSADPTSPSFTKTITELIYVPSRLADGPFLLDLQVAAMHSDAVLSRPLLFKVETS